jgi:hypothetical protein
LLTIKLGKSSFSASLSRINAANPQKVYLNKVTVNLSSMPLNHNILRKVRDIPTMSFSMRFPSNTTFISLAPGSRKYRMLQSCLCNWIIDDNFNKKKTWLCNPQHILPLHHQECLQGWPPYVNKRNVKIIERKM